MKPLDTNIVQKCQIYVICENLCWVCTSTPLNWLKLYFSGAIPFRFKGIYANGKTFSSGKPQEGRLQCNRSLGWGTSPPPRQDLGQDFEQDHGVSRTWMDLGPEAGLPAFVERHTHVKTLPSHRTTYAGGNNSLQDEHSVDIIGSPNAIGTQFVK